MMRIYLFFFFFLFLYFSSPSHVTPSTPFVLLYRYNLSDSGYFFVVVDGRLIRQVYRLCLSPCLVIRPRAILSLL